MPQGQIRKNPAGDHGGAADEADIGMAKSKIQKKPAVKGRKAEKKVRKGGAGGPQGTQKSINQTQHPAGQQTVKTSEGGKLRRDHEKNRLSQPPAGRESS